MITKLSEEELFSLKELLISNAIYMESLVQLLLDKGIISREDLLEKIKQVQMENFLEERQELN